MTSDAKLTELPPQHGRTLLGYDVEGVEYGPLAGERLDDLVRELRREGSVYVQGVYPVEATNGVEQLPDGYYTLKDASPLHGGSPLTRRWRARLIEAPIPLVSRPAWRDQVIDAQNRLTNGDFATYATTPGAPGSWTSLGGNSSQLIREPDVIRTPNYALKIANDGSLTDPGVQQAVPALKDGYAYEAVAWARSASGAAAASRPILRVRDTTNSVNYDAQGLQKSYPNWEKLRVVFPYASAASWQVRLVSEGSTSGRFVYWEDALLRASPFDESCTDGYKFVYTPTTSEVVVLDPRNLAGAEPLNLPGWRYRAVLRWRPLVTNSQLVRFKVLDLDGTVKVTGSQKTAAAANVWEETKLGDFTVTPNAQWDAKNWYSLGVQGVTGQLNNVEIDRLAFVPIGSVS